MVTVLLLLRESRSVCLEERRAPCRRSHLVNCVRPATLPDHERNGGEENRPGGGGRLAGVGSVHPSESHIAGIPGRRARRSSPNVEIRDICAPCPTTATPP